MYNIFTLPEAGLESNLRDSVQWVGMMQDHSTLLPRKRGFSGKGCMCYRWQLQSSDQICSVNVQAPGTSWSWCKAASTCEETDWSPSTFSVLFFLWQDFFLHVDYTLTCSVVEDANPNLPKYFTACNSLWASSVIIIHQSPCCSSQETTQLMHCNLKALHHHLEFVMPLSVFLATSRIAVICKHTLLARCGKLRFKKASSTTGPSLIGVYQCSTEFS